MVLDQTQIIESIYYSIEVVFFFYLKVTVDIFMYSH